MATRLVITLLLSVLLASCTQEQESAPVVKKPVSTKPVQTKYPISAQMRSKPAAPIHVQPVIQSHQEINLAVAVSVQAPAPPPAPPSLSPAQLKALQDEEDMRTFAMLSGLEKLNAVNIARRLNAGQGHSLCREELEWAQTVPFLRRQIDTWVQQQSATSPLYKEMQRLALPKR